MKLQAKILSLLIPLLVMPLLISGWIAYDRLLTAKKEDVFGNMDALMKQFASSIQFEIETAKANIELFSNSSLLHNYIIIKDPGERYSLMQPPLLRVFSSYQKAYPEYYEIRVILPDGFEDARVTSIPVRNLRENESGSSFFQEMSRSDQLIYSNIQCNPDNNEISLFISKKLLALDNELDPVLSSPAHRGYLVVTISLSSLEKQIRDIRIGKKGFMFISDNHGNLLFHPDRKKVKTALPPDFFRQLVFICIKDSSPLKFEYDGKSYILHGESITPQLMLFAALPENELLAASHNLAAIVAGITFGAIMITAGLIFFALKLLVISPISKLNDAIITVGEGDLSARIAIKKYDEIGILASEFNRMTESLRDVTVSRDYVDSIFATMKDGLLVILPDFRIESVNAGTCMLLEYSEPELLDKPVMMVFKKIDFSFLDQIVEKDCSSLEKTCLTKSSKEIDVLFTSSIMREENGEVKKIICVIKDVTELKRSEQEKKELEIRLLEERNRSLEEISQYKSKFLANISHELRTPLNSLLLLCHNLLKNSDKNLNERQVDNLRIINDSGNELLLLISELLDLSTIEAGKIKLDIRDISISDIKNHIVDIFKYVFARKSLFFEVNISDQLPEKISTDSYRLLQILKNLVSNAIKFTEKGGVTMDIYYAENAISNGDQKSKDDGSVVFSVSDTGIGIPGNKIVQVFESFEQIDSGISRKYGGVGLGLSISKELAVLLGGEIQVKSIVGEGSIFRLILPLRQFPVDFEHRAEEFPNIIDWEVFSEIRDQKTSFSVLCSSGNSAPDIHVLHGKKVMIADNDVRTLYTLEERLKSLDIEVIKSVDGRQALDIIHSRNDIDIVLLDTMLPVVNGLDVVREIRINEKLSNLPVIVMSGRTLTDSRSACLSTGEFEYIEKPVNMNELLSLLVRCSINKEINGKP